MLGIETLTGPSYAAALVGFVLVEAMILYVGYGTLTQVAGSAVTDAIRGSDQ